MCDYLDAQFVVPKRPSAVIGWWLGQSLTVGGCFFGVNVLWTQFPVPDSRNEVVMRTPADAVIEFDTLAEAMAHLSKQKERAS